MEKKYESRILGVSSFAWSLTESTTLDFTCCVSSSQSGLPSCVPELKGPICECESLGIL